MWSQIAQTKKSMRHAEASLAQWVIQEGRGLVVVVNNMDLLSGRDNAHLRSLVMRAVPEEIQKASPSGFPLFFSRYFSAMTSCCNHYSDAEVLLIHSLF